MKFLEDARSLIQRGYYQEALEILDDRLKSKQEISPERLNEYYKCRSVCLAIAGNIPDSIGDYQTFISKGSKTVSGKMRGFNPLNYLGFILKESGCPEGSKRYKGLKEKLLSQSLLNGVKKYNLQESKLLHGATKVAEKLKPVVSYEETNYRELVDSNNPKVVPQCEKATENLTKKMVEDESEKFKNEILTSLQFINLSVDESKSLYQSLDQEIHRLDHSIKDKASLNRLRGQARSIRKYVDRVDSRINEKISRLESDHDCLNDQIDSLVLNLDSHQSKNNFEFIAHSCHRTFLKRIAYRIPPLRIILLGALASSGYFFTQLALSSALPSRVNPYVGDPSKMIVTLPYPLSRAREFLREKFLIKPQKSSRIIREKYPELLSAGDWPLL